MDNPAYQSECGVDLGVATRHPRRPLARANSTLTPTTRLVSLTQAPRSKLCRCNSVLVSPSCCADEGDGAASATTALDYPFFAKKPPAKNILTDNSLWTKEFWSGNFNRLHDSSPVFQKFPSTKSDVSTIYDPQFLAGKRPAEGAPHPHKEWWPGPGGWLAAWRWQSSGHPSCHKALVVLCAVLLTALATANILYILKTVGKPQQSANKGNWIDVVLITGEFRITNEPYRVSFANTTSDEFHHLANIISNQLDSLFSLSVLSEPYHSTAVTALLPGVGPPDLSTGLIVQCQLVLRASAHLTASKVGLAFIAGLRNHGGHVWLGNFSVDIQSIGFQASGDAVSWSNWSDWKDCQLTQEFGYVRLRYRNCTLRSGLYLQSSLPCLLVPHSHGNVETAPCASLTTSTYSLPPLMEEAESNLVLARVANHSERSERIVTVTREDCNTSRASKDIPELTPLNSSVVANHSVENGTRTGACQCNTSQVCVALSEQSTPRCLAIVDTADPTGCGGHCRINTQVCQKIQDNAFRCVDDSKCLEDEWQCGNQLCIPSGKRCDGHFNCYDHTDEYHCDCVGANQFTCNDSQCIPEHRFCDGFPDCKDHSDEPFGCGGDCKTHEWRCNNGRCIPQSQQCDGTDNCGDSSDEDDCPTVSPD